MKMTKLCKRCKQRKALFLYSKHNNHKYGVKSICKKCDTEKKAKDRELAINWKFPYKNVNQPEYIKARNEFFSEDYGWWCNDGKGWELNPESPIVKSRRMREKYG